MEGAEIDALQGAARTLRDGSIIVFEDHGSDPDCEVSDYILNTLGLDVLHVGDHGFEAIGSLDEIRGVKVDPAVGYNFVGGSGDSALMRHLAQYRK